MTDSAKLPLQNLRIFGKSEQVQTTGKNILDIDSAVKKGWNLDITNIHHFVAGETYTMSVVSLNDSICGLYLDDSVKLVNYIAPGKSASFVMPDKATFTKMSLAGGSATALTKDISKVKIQIEKGESATSFEPYTGGKPSPSQGYPQEITIAGESGTIDLEITGENVEPQTLIVSTPNGLPGLKVDKDGNYTDSAGQQWICDEIDLARGKYIQRLEKKTFNGSEQLGDNIGNKTSYLLKIDNVREDIGMCNYGKRIPITGQKQEELTISVDETGIYLYTTKSLDEFKDEIKQKYDSGKPAEVLYALKAQIEKDLTQEEIQAYKALRTNYLTTSVSNNADTDMELTYTVDTKSYVDSKIATLSKAIL